jgi:ADP-heptose:LPS heptosyltransferase
MTEIKSNLYVLQLNRIGDVFQAIRAINTLTVAVNPATVFTLVVRKELIPQIPATILMQSNISLLDLENFILTKSSEAAFVANLSFCHLSATIKSQLTNTKLKFYGRYDEAGITHVYGGWYKYIYGVVQTSNNNPFNLVDLFVKCLLESTGYTPLEQNEPIRNHNPIQFNSIIFHPFAGDEKKAFKMNKWVDIFNNIELKGPATCFMVGGKEDVNHASEFMNNMTNPNIIIKNYVGNSSFADIYSLATDNDLFIGHDSSVGHLFALKNIYSLTIALGFARSFENAPVGNGLIASPKTHCFPCHQDTQCNYYQCHFDVPSRELSQLISNLMDNQVEINSASLPSKLRIIQKMQTDGLQTLIPINDNNSIDELFKAIYFLTFELFLDNKDIKLNPKIPPKDALIKLLPYKEGVQYVYELACFGRKYCKFILQESIKESPSNDAINEFNIKLTEIDLLLEQMRSKYEHLKPIINWYFVNQANLEGNTITQLALNADNCYMELELMCSTTYELINSLTAAHDKQTTKIVEK